jgi:glycosyltransferase involved in cell wall biosynthesis
MRIGVDATCWDNNRGYGRHSRALLRALIRLDAGSVYTLFLDTPATSNALPEGCEARFVESDAPAVVAASAKGRRSLGDMWRMSRAMSAQPFDILLFPTVYSYIPVFSSARKLVIFHDVIAETFPQLTLPRLSARMFWKAKVAMARFQADAVVTVSDYSKQCLVRHFGTSPAKVRVVGEAPDRAFKVLDHPALTPALTSCGILPDHRKVVYVGGFGPHKNLPALLDAFAKLNAPDLRLILVGEHKNEVFHSTYAQLRGHIEKLGIQDRVIFTGYLSDDDVAILLNLATVLVLPSLMEGYGLPAVEAAACGCPVIATKESPLPGLLGDGALYIEPTSEAVHAALESVVQSEDLQNKMSQAGRVAAGKLTWDFAARQMLDVIESVGRPALKEVSLASR